MTAASPLRPEAGSPHTRAGGDASDGELVAMLLEDCGFPRDARRLAGDLLDECGGLHHLLCATEGRLFDMGLRGPAVRRLRAAGLAGLRAASFVPASAPMDAGTLAAMFTPRLTSLRHEELHVVLLDGAARCVGRRRVAVGGDSVLSVLPRDVLGVVVEERSPRFAVVHNHPSGSCRPSPEDVALTSRLVEGARTLGVMLVDHLVVATEGFSSAMPNGAHWPGGRTVRRVV